VKIIRSGRLDIEEQWKTLLPLCLHNNYDAWWQNDVEPYVHCWDDMVIAFKKQFGSESSFGRNIEKLWPMKMKNDETISQYTTRFLRAAHEAKFNPKNYYLASFFVSSLVEPVKEKLKSSWYAVHSEDERYMVQQAASLVSNILRGDYSVSPVSSGSSRSRTSDYVSARASGGSFSFVKQKRGDSSAGGNGFYCKRHGTNGSHATENCISMSKGKVAEKARNDYHDKGNRAYTANTSTCKYGCGNKWSPNHWCDNYFHSEDYKRKRAAEDRVVLSIKKAVFDNK